MLRSSAHGHQDTGLFSNFSNSPGGIATVIVLAVLLFIYLVALIFTIRGDRKDARGERVPTPEEINHFSANYVRYAFSLPRRFVRRARRPRDPSHTHTFCRDVQ